MAAGKNGGKILIIDDEESILFSLSTLLTREKYVCDTANSGDAGLKKFRDNRFEYDLVITDLMMPGIDGMQVLKAVKELRPQTYVVMLTAHGNAENAVQAMKFGAYDYVSKPYENEKIKIIARHIFEKINLDRENLTLKHQLKGQHKLIGTSENMVMVREKILKVSGTDVTVLITGESGTGKELIAREIHQQSGRRHKNFVTLNCAAIPADLLENELFGHEKGAYTGAHGEQKGKFELADGGSLFLDEIGDMPIQIQAKVLRAIQEQVIERLGGTAPVKVNVRIIAATNKDLEEEIKRKNFREDLYYRLNVINIMMPPLRDRRGDILLLIKHFISIFSGKLSKPEPRLTAAAANMLAGYDWPGNVRQLQNTIERLLVLTDRDEITESSIIEIADLKGISASDNAAPPLCLIEEPELDTGYYKIDCIENLSFHDAQKSLNEQFEADFITRALIRNGGNIKKTAEQIGLDRSQLHVKIKNLKIDVDQLKEKDVL
jgi:two-component system nitrogen regulation response regulator NtrX